MASRRLDPLTWNIQIVDKEGRPTPEFMRKWEQQLVVNGGIPEPANPTATAGQAAVNGTLATYMRSDAAPALRVATDALLGIVRPDNVTITVAAGVLTALSATTFANPTATAGPAAVNGAAATAMRSDAAPAVQLGTAVQKGIVQVDGVSITAAAGVISAVQPAGANPTGVAGPAAVNGVATTFMRSDAAPAVQKASAAQFGIVEVDGTTITAALGVISAVQPAGANPSATAGPAVVNGVATTFMRSDAAPAVQLATAVQKGLVQVDGTTITVAAGVISAVQPAGANPTATAKDTAVNGAATTFMRSDGAPAVQKGSSTQYGIVKNDGTSITDDGNGVLSAAGFVPLEAAFQPGYVTGRYYMSPFMSASGTLTIAANTLYACPFYVSKTTTWTEIAVTVQTLAGGKTVRLGIYNNSDGKPSSLKLDCGTVSVGATGQAAVAISQSLTPGWYWLALVCDGTPTLRNLGATVGFNYLLGNTVPTDGVQVGLTAAFTYGVLSGADPFPAVTYNSNTTPLISLRK